MFAEAPRQGPSARCLSPSAEQGRPLEPKLQQLDAMQCVNSTAEVAGAFLRPAVWLRCPAATLPRAAASGQQLLGVSCKPDPFLQGDCASARPPASPAGMQRPGAAN